MKTPPSIIRSTMSWIITVLIPFLIMIAVVRLLMTSLFLNIEYRTPNFPADQFGFTMSDRLKWAPYAVDYLTNRAGINYLADLRFQDGNALYNIDELSHMQDVKVLVQLLLKLWWVFAALLILLGVWAWRSHWLVEFCHAIGRGGWLTVGLIIAILLTVMISFNSLFITFHQIFFPGGNWQFPTSDTLIRLFPLRFWQDCFIGVGSLSLLAGLALGIGFLRKSSI